MRNNPGKSMTIYDVLSLVRDALPLVTTPTNIIKGFKVTGIEPFNREIFDDADFLPASVTDQPPPPPPSSQIVEVEEPIATTSSHIVIPECSASTSNFHPTSQNKAVFSPELVRPLPKAQQRKTTTRG